MLQKVKTNYLEINETTESLRKEKDDTKKNQTKTLQLKNIITKIKEFF